jgi:hypothetical protein
MMCERPDMRFGCQVAQTARKVIPNIGRFVLPGKKHALGDRIAAEEMTVLIIMKQGGDDEYQNETTYPAHQ